MTTKSETLSDSVSAFAALWFGLPRRARAAGRLEACLSADDLEMVFPERTLRSVAEFRDWYRTVCGLYTDETHEIEQVTPTRSGHHIDVGVVVWRATQTSDGSRLAMRARQTWRLSPADTEPGLAQCATARSSRLRHTAASRAARQQCATAGSSRLRHTAASDAARQQCATTRSSRLRHTAASDAARQQCATTRSSRLRHTAVSGAVRQRGVRELEAAVRR
jgi:hypothetical protein